MFAIQRAEVLVRLCTPATSNTLDVSVEPDESWSVYAPVLAQPVAAFSLVRNLNLVLRTST